MSVDKPVRAPELTELETLVACAAEGSLAGAAAQLAITRPAVAKRIANVEAIVGKPVLARSGRGVRLTEAGAALLSGARRMLDERDVLLSTIAEIRDDGPSPIAGLRDLLGHSTAVKRATQLPEARLAETERVLELILRASATGVAVSDAETSVLYEVNDAFCRILGRTRAELLGRAGVDLAVWQDATERDRLAATMKRTGELERAIMRVRRPDGTVRVIETTSHYVALGGKRHVVSTVDDVTDALAAAAAAS
jgi:PAS domain S-box-containing protein